MPDKTKNLFAVEEPQINSNHVIQVAFDSAADAEFSYLVPDKLWPVKVGQRVEAPFGRSNKKQTGFCVATEVKRPASIKLKAVTKVIDAAPLLNSELMSLARWISQYYICPLGQVISAMIPAAVKKQAGVRKERLAYLARTDDEIISKIKGKKQKNIIQYLKSQSAFDKDSAIKVSKVLDKADCKASPLNRLAENGIIKITERQILVSLPAIPEGMTLKSESVILNLDQQNAMAHFSRQIDSGEFGVTLLYGVTDSGKTELYIRSVEQVIKKGKSAIVLLPEIALTAQTIQRFSDRFENIAVMHSGLTAAQRNVQWQNIKSGKANVIIGARSAVFAPVDNLGLVVVDEEHEPGYKQDTTPRYHGRDVAVKRAQLAGAHCILGSATPSLETLLNCKNRKHYYLIRLPKRVKDLPMPEMKVIDLKKFHPAGHQLSLISEHLLSHLKSAIAKGRQAILMLNRRGYSNFIFCPACKNMLHCRNCDVTLTFHKSKMSSSSFDTASGKMMNYGYALCHYCGRQTLVPQKCPLCGKGFAMIGFGSQRLEEELASKLPGAKIARIDSDTMAGKDYYHILKDFGDGKINILAGTQMLAKGLHFPNVTVIGIISAETSLYLPDFRANERTFQLISQVSGRTGRGTQKGTVYVQTFVPDQPAIVFAMKNDFDGFVVEELKHRRQCNLPPYWRMANIVMRDTNYEKLQQASAAMRQRIDGIIAAHNLNIKLRGPVDALISRIQRYHRMQIVIQGPNAVTIQKLFASLRSSSPIRPAVKIAIDIDSINLF